MIELINAYIVTMNDKREEIVCGYLIIENEIITSLGHMNNYKTLGGQVIDCTDQIIMPGMINLHTHLAMIPFRSYADDVKDRLQKYLFPLEKACLNEKFVYHSSSLAVAECLLGGTTTVLDMYYYENEVAKACQKFNIRAFLAQTLIDGDHIHFEESFNSMEELFKQYSTCD